jgi:membrane protease YdiL (CAAX protease family)
MTAAILAIPVALLPRRLCSARNVLVTLIGELAFAAAVVLWVRRVKKAPVAALGLPRRPLGDIGAGIAAGAGLIVIGGIVGVIVNSVATRILGHSPTQPEQVASCVRGSGLLAMAPVVILAAPLGEETLFRGFLYRGLRRRFSVWPAAIISGVAFGAVHFAGLSFLLLIPPLIVVGMGLAWIYERRQSLLASMAAHATFNLVGILFIAANRR